jgi:MSHA biogenesis protein MshK
VAGRLTRHLTILFAVACMAIASSTFAQALRDPTRPPAASAKNAAAKAEQSGWILQSVLISPERRYAIINGEVVPVGGSIAGAELVAIAAERVTLRTQEGLRVIHLLPDVTRLGAVDTGTGATKRMPVPEAEKDSKAQRSGSSGMKNEKDK